MVWRKCGNPIGGCEILKTLKQNFKKNELFEHCSYASLANVMYKIFTSNILEFQASW